MPDACGAGPCALEWNLRRPGKARPYSVYTAACARFRVERTSRRGRHLAGLSLVRSEILSSGQYPDEGRSHQHGSFDRSAAAVSRSSDRGIRKLAPGQPENPGWPAKGDLEEPDARQTRSGDPQEKKD